MENRDEKFDDELLSTAEKQGKGQSVNDQLFLLKMLLMSYYQRHYSEEPNQQHLHRKELLLFKKRLLRKMNAGWDFEAEVE